MADPIQQTTPALDAMIQATRLVPIERLLAQIGRDPGSAREMLAALDKLGIVLLYHSDIQQMGEIGDICTWDRTGQVCPYCKCGRAAAPG